MMIAETPIKDHTFTVVTDDSVTPIDDIDFPRDLDDWARDKKVCQYFNDEDEREICTEDPKFFIRTYCWDPGCDEIHTWYYCLPHFAANIGTLAHYLCAIEPSEEIIWYLKEGDVPPRYQIIEWGRIGEEGTHPLPTPFSSGSSD